MSSIERQREQERATAAAAERKAAESAARAAGTDGYCRKRRGTVEGFCMSKLCCGRNNVGWDEYSRRDSKGCRYGGGGRVRYVVGWNR